MTDALKIFIQQHRDAFDAAAIQGKWVWPGVERMLERLPHADALESQLMCDRVLLDTELPSEALWGKIERELYTPDLESFIHRNRDAFDSAVPSERAWEQITGSLPKPSAKVVHIGWQRSIMRIAASIALLVAGIGGGIWYERQASASQGMAMGQVSIEYAELEQYYQREISSNRKKLASYAGSQPAEVSEDLQNLDRVMEELRQELASVPPGNREQVVRAMIENYKAKTAILKRVLERLEESNSDDSNNRGDNSKQSNGIKNI